MGQLVLREEILERLKTDPILFGKVADALDTTVSYALALIRKNDTDLTKATVLRILKEELNVEQDSDLLTELQEVTN